MQSGPRQARQKEAIAISVAVGKTMTGFVPLPTSDAHARRELLLARSSGVVRTLISARLLSDKGQTGGEVTVDKISELIRMSEGSARTNLRRLIEAGVACEQRRGRRKSRYHATSMCIEQFAQSIAPRLVCTAGARLDPPYSIDALQRVLQFWSSVDVAWARTGRDVEDDWRRFRHKNSSSTPPIDVSSVFAKPRCVAILQVLVQNSLIEAEPLSSRQIKRQLWFPTDTKTLDKLIMDHLIPASLVRDDSMGAGAGAPRQYRTTNATMAIVADVATPHLEHARDYARRMIMKAERHARQPRRSESGGSNS